MKSTNVESLFLGSESTIYPQFYTLYITQTETLENTHTKKKYLLVLLFVFGVRDLSWSSRNNIRCYTAALRDIWPKFVAC